MSEQEKQTPTEQAAAADPQSPPEAAAEAGTAEELSDAELLLQAQQLAESLANEKLALEQQHLRLQADFDNFRKRSRQEKDETVKQANARLIADLLPVLDNFERALAALAESSEREGVQMICRQLVETLAAAGLQPIEALGTDFDPKLHEAVLQTASEPENKGKVIGEAQKGYLLNGKLLRPSMVQIGC